jgi:hypothetical protein
MPIKSLAIMSTVLATISCAIAAVGLVHELLSARDPHMLMLNLEGWTTTVGYHVALIVLAAGAVTYLASKKP